MTPATAVPVSEVPNSTAPHPPGPTRAQREKRFRTQKRQQQNENKHISRRKHARRRRGKHGGQGGGESRHCARVRETRQLRIVGPKELPRRPTCAPRQAPPCGRSVAAPGECAGQNSRCTPPAHGDTRHSAPRPRSAAPLPLPAAASCLALPRATQQTTQKPASAPPRTCRTAPNVSLHVDRVLHPGEHLRGRAQQ